MTHTADTPCSEAETSPVLANMFSFLSGAPIKPIEIKSEPICTHYMFEGPMLFED